MNRSKIRLIEITDLNNATYLLFYLHRKSILIHNYSTGCPQNNNLVRNAASWNDFSLFYMPIYRMSYNYVYITDQEYLSANTRFFYKKHNYKKQRTIILKTLRNI